MARIFFIVEDLVQPCQFGHFIIRFRSGKAKKGCRVGTAPVVSGKVFALR